MYENSNAMDEESKNYLNSINTLAVNDVKNLEFSQGNIVLQVTARKAMVDKYDVAVVKHTIDFSKATYSDAYNKFSQYVSENKTIEDLEKNAEKFGFKVQERKDMFNSEHNVVGLRATREAMKWIFDAKVGEVSPLYECGSNDNLLVVALTKVNPIGYRSLSDVQELVKPEVIRDKKFVSLPSQVLWQPSSRVTSARPSSRVMAVPSSSVSLRRPSAKVPTSMRRLWSVSSASVPSRPLVDSCRSSTRRPTSWITAICSSKE